MADHAQVIHEICYNGNSMLPQISIAHIIYCKDCIHRPVRNSDQEENLSISPPRKEESQWPDETCPYLCGDDPWYNKMPHDDYFCNFGERK